MTQEDKGTDAATGSIKGQLFDWLTNNLFFAIVPLFVSYLALSISRNPVAVLGRGDAFIITAALLAPEIAALRNLKPDTVTGNAKALLNVMFLLVILSTVLFVTSTSDYNATHPDIPINKENPSSAAILANIKSAEASPPFPTLTPTVVNTLSILMLLGTIVLVSYSIRERQRIGGVS
jgi:hypothetical protein